MEAARIRALFKEVQSRLSFFKLIMQNSQKKLVKVSMVEKASIRNPISGF